MGLSGWLNVSENIYRTTSDYNGVIYVKKDKDGSLRVVAGGPTQSISYDSKRVKDLFWGKFIEYIREKNIRPKNVLILGFCAGTAAHLLNKEFKNIKMTGVEIDKEMTRIGKMFFNIDTIPNLEVINMDAYDYLKRNKEKFDLIFVDTYLGSKFPSHLSSTEFLQYVKDSLTKDGRCFVNMLYVNNVRSEANNFKKYMTRIFENVEELVVEGKTGADNILLIGSI